MPRSRILPPILAMGFVLAGCFGGTDASPTPSVTTTPQPTAAPTDEPTPSPSPTPHDTPSPSPSPTASPSPVTSGPPGGFAIVPHPEADDLFTTPDACTNERDHYEVTFPDDWWTNTEIGKYAACVWFSPTFYEVPDPDRVPEEIAITIERVPGDVGSRHAEILSSQEVIVGGQAATRVEWQDETYWYVVQLGPTPEEGPNLWVRTSAEMGGDYDLNKAVMDRMMATIEFFGSTQ